MSTIHISVDSARTLCIKALTKRRVPHESAELIVDSLINSETLGYRSHGILRLLDYINEIDLGNLNPIATPSISRLGENFWKINGERSFGQLSAKEISKILAHDDGNTIKAVALTNAHHIGRLADVVPSKLNNSLIIGCCNYMGHGQRVAPPRGKSGKLCTNPILLAIPNKNKQTIILDMTTSHVAEGKIREYWMSGKLIPDGWLVDKEGKPTSDPSKLYSSPPEAFMTPLGGEMSYKGFWLSFFVEIISGIMTGGGFCGNPSPISGNSGVFLSIPINIFGEAQHIVHNNISILINEIKSGENHLRMPGERSRKHTSFIEIPENLFVSLDNLSNK